MSLLVSDVIARFRDQFYDVDPAGYRLADETLYSYIGAACRKLAELRPESATAAWLYTVAAGPRQRLDPTADIKLLEVVRNPEDAGVLGEPIRKVERDVLDTFYAAWPAATAGAVPTQRYKAWAADAQDPLAFWLFPGGLEGDEIQIKSVYLPTDPTNTASSLDVPDVYVNAVVDYMTHLALLAESRGMDTAESQRYFDQFLGQLGLERATHVSVGQEKARPPEALA